MSFFSPTNQTIYSYSPNYYALNVSHHHQQPSSNSLKKLPTLIPMKIASPINDSVALDISSSTLLVRPRSSLNPPPISTGPFALPLSVTSLSSPSSSSRTSSADSLSPLPPISIDFSKKSSSVVSLPDLVSSPLDINNNDNNNKNKNKNKSKSKSKNKNNNDDHNNNDNIQPSSGKKTSAPPSRSASPINKQKTNGGANSGPMDPQKKYQCRTCTKSFTTSGHLARHTRIHTGERKHACPYPNCESRFARQDNCMQHYRTHLNGGKRKRKKW
ncbi:transcriptional regulator [Saccharomycopsis crataegensis]|uniref:Transcriptional regulator n=1 Tax=Saccharomycopsis crataegensis TaxID=43959 RepID=A0AAV5QGY5_9ASCO|nr:transcriptional regulator [Saccharomycopsis crataegensis]